MKRYPLVSLCIAAVISAFVSSESRASNVGFSISVFESPLSQCGYWIDRPPYGRCWYPTYISSSWRPYTNGYWMWTDDGWYWVSDEPWAWACYHYGRWVNDSYYSWIWVPDTEWGPSWVAWRSSDEYVGWAPLPPGCRFGAGGEFVFREEVIRPSAFVFVDVHHFAEPVSPHTVIINNQTIINKTVNVTKISRVNNVVINNGPNVQVVQKFNQRKFTVAPEKVSRWSGISTPRHPAPEVLQPLANPSPREVERRSIAEQSQPQAIRPKMSVPGAVVARETAAPKSELKEKRTEKEQPYQNFGPRPYPYGKVPSAYSEQPKTVATERRERSSQSPKAGEKDTQQERGQGRGGRN
jgi:hypothetical protein